MSTQEFVTTRQFRTLIFNKLLSELLDSGQASVNAYSLSDSFTLTLKCTRCVNNTEGK